MKSPAEMSNDEIRRELTDCAITLESIRPYRSKDVSQRQAALRAELDSRIKANSYSSGKVY